MTETVLPEDFNRQTFLRDYWQKKPLLIRAGTLSFIDPITPEELAGLACEPAVESRLIQVNPQQTDWQLRCGPFTEQDFLSLPESRYSLLVQGVDQWVDDVSALLQDFDFIPAWRVDDVMVSYATDQGNVGPHFDYYDVFLIQGQGQKRWQIGKLCDHTTPVDDHSGLKLLRDFKPEQEWTVYPGDILYLPPGIAHYGVAEGNAMTYSVGFRAPSWAEIVSGVIDDAIDTLHEDQRYTDPHPRLPMHSGEIPADVITQLQSLVHQLADNPELIRRWFGKTMTSPKYPLDPQEHAEHQLDSIRSLKSQLEQGAILYKVPGARFAYSCHDNSLELFADGECYPAGLHTLSLLQALSKPGHIEPLPADVIAATLTDEDAAQLLLSVYNQGCLVLD